VSTLGDTPDEIAACIQVIEQGKREIASAGLVGEQ
jgi:hypothetical protein